MKTQMLGGFLNSLRDWNKFRLAPRASKNIVFYAESGSYQKYLRPIIDELTDGRNYPVSYVTSDANDTLLDKNSDLLSSYCINSTPVLIVFFQTLDVRVLAMTMPDLNTYHVKRSRHDVHYAYIHHSMVSSHMIYHPRAFDAFDSIFCVGPYQKIETREWESANNLPQKQLFEHGYAPLDTLLEFEPEDRTFFSGANKKSKVLVAPSWGPSGLIENYGVDLVRYLLQAGHMVTVRPHPKTLKNVPDVISEIEKLYGFESSFRLEKNIAGFESFYESDVMISDWSGAALEFALGLERPVLFIDVPPKINNSQFENIVCTPIEVELRSEIGTVIDPAELANVDLFIDSAIAGHSETIFSIRRVRKERIFNVGHSHIAAANHLESLIGTRGQLSRGLGT